MFEGTGLRGGLKCFEQSQGLDIVLHNNLHKYLYCSANSEVMDDYEGVHQRCHRSF